MQYLPNKYLRSYLFLLGWPKSCNISHTDSFCFIWPLLSTIFFSLWLPPPKTFGGSLHVAFPQAPSRFVWLSRDKQLMKNGLFIWLPLIFEVCQFSTRSPVWKESLLSFFFLPNIDIIRPVGSRGQGRLEPPNNRQSNGLLHKYSIWHHILISIVQPPKFMISSHNLYYWTWLCTRVESRAKIFGRERQSWQEQWKQQMEIGIGLWLLA